MQTVQYKIDIESQHEDTHVETNKPKNKLASLEATLVRNYDSLTDWLTHRGKV